VSKYVRGSTVNEDLRFFNCFRIVSACFSVIAGLCAFLEKESSNIPFIDRNELLARCVHEEVVKKSGLIDRGIKKAAFVVLTSVNMPAVQIEVGFLSNKEDEAKLISDQFQEKIAQAVFEGIMKFKRSYSMEKIIGD